ncbi:glutamate-cysteine ligase family protein [Pigmentiphaga aceris]|nr:glutamate-cysteine ligase family protein [Pigmentiphaga aceris]
MVVANQKTGRSHAVSGYFDSMSRRKRARGQVPQQKQLSGKTVAVLSDGVDSGLDNAFNHLESALGPVQGGAGGLARLDAMVTTELGDVIDALAEEGAVLLNTSEHPDCPTDEAAYRAVRAPKPLYDHWVDYRGWQHRVGIDAKAQNGPTTSIPLALAARAVNVVLAAAPASIALFANSPLEGGMPTGLKENRLSIWPRMFAAAKFPCDARLSQTPGRRFSDLADYFRRAYGVGTVMHTVPLASSRDYKGASHTARPEGDPSLMRFLAESAWPGIACDSGESVMLAPSAMHFEYLQFMPFLDARFRFRFGSLPPVPELLEALHGRRNLETLMAEYGAEGYIEGRCPGANFPDAGLLAEAGADVAATVVMSASAVQAGLLANLEEAEKLVADWGWQRLLALRQPAVAAALDDAAVHAFAGEVLAVARAGLDAGDRHWLGYADWVWQNKRTGADRMLETWHSLGGDRDQRLAGLAAQQTVLHPSQWATAAVI